MDSKPVVTYAGDATLFQTLEPSLSQGLPQEPMEWRRSFGRAVKSVHIEAAFVVFQESVLPKEDEQQKYLLGQPVFHTFWTDCTDVEVYKSSVRDSIHCWLTKLRQHEVYDWMVVLVETPDGRKGNKLLPRTTVLDKIRSDFAAKQGERCISVLDPGKCDSRSNESWQTLLYRFRQLLLVAYNRTLGRFEDGMRSQRERRNEAGWSFCEYFVVQEELAFVYEMLGLYDEALVQYDELDALFTQFVLNSNIGESPPWLASFQRPLEHWSGLLLSQHVDRRQRELIRTNNASLLDFRNYLFGRQCAMLLLLFRPWEIAQRSLVFLHNCLNELRILEVQCEPDGAVACWVFLSCVEVLRTCERFNDSGQVEAYSLYTADLWAYARQKLAQLGDLCGLMPWVSTSSLHLHTVVGLSAGILDPAEPPGSPRGRAGANQQSAVDRLKEALSSKEAFRKHYLELSELAMGTYKHIGRLRSARLIGKDLAEFYLQTGEAVTAAGFLSDALQAYKEQGWAALEHRTAVQLARCYQIMGDQDKYIKVCAQVASAPDLPDEARHHHFDEMMVTLKGLPEDEQVLVAAEDMFDVASLTTVTKGKVIGDCCDVEIQVQVYSRLLKAVLCDVVQVIIHQVQEPSSQTPSRHSKGRDRGDSEKKSSQRRKSVPPSAADKSQNPPLEPCEVDACSDPTIIMKEEFEYQQDRSLSLVKLTCINPNKVLLRRKDSTSSSQQSANNKFRPDLPQVVKREGEMCPGASQVVLAPGLNKVSLQAKVTQPGLYRPGQVALRLGSKLEAVTRCGVGCPSGGSFRVEFEPTRVMLTQPEGSPGELLAGVCQQLVLEIRTGSRGVGGWDKPNSQGEKLQEKSQSKYVDNGELVLKSSRGMTLRENMSDPNPPGLASELRLHLPPTPPFDSLRIPLDVDTNLPPRKDCSVMEHRVTIQCPWSSEEKDVAVFFAPPLMTSHKLHTANTRKFLQVTVHGLSSRLFELSSHKLVAMNQDVKLTALNPAEQIINVSTNLTASYMWEVDVESASDRSPLRLEYRLDYRPLLPPPSDPAQSAPPWKQYRCTIELNDFKTLYTIRSRVDPPKGCEFCRAESMCSMQICMVQEAEPTGQSGGTHSLMYEVRADKSMWAVCGNVAGVISVDSMASKKLNISLDVMPLIGGFLPLPSVCLSKYIPAEQKDALHKSGESGSVSRLQPFGLAQVYNWSRGQQVLVLPAATGAASSVGADTAGSG